MSDVKSITVPLPGVIAHFAVDGAMKASEFYAKAFGAKEVRRQPAEDGKRLMHCQMEMNGGTFMFCDGFPEYGHAAKTDGTYTMQLVVADGHVWWDRAIAAGVQGGAAVQEGVLGRHVWPDARPVRDCVGCGLARGWSIAMQRISVARMAGVALLLMLASCKGERELFVTLDPDAPETVVDAR